MNYTVSLLYTCNSRCNTCNIWKKQAKNLTLDEYQKIFKNIGKCHTGLLSAEEEPFLRNDIVDVVTAIYKISHPRIINIPTNGILVQTIIEKTDAIASACTKSKYR